MALSRPLLAVAAGASLAFAAWAYATYPTVGQLTYQLGSRAESYLYGLHKERVVVDGVPMALYRSAGQGEAILMLHGFSADKDVWARFARHFSATHQVVIPDVAGHGETGFQTDWSYSMPSQVDRLIKLMDQLGIQKAHVIGNSMGGHIAAQMAVSHPDRVLSAGLVDPAGLPQPHPSDMQKMFGPRAKPLFV